jgi:hypothetical protein
MNRCDSNSMCPVLPASLPASRATSQPKLRCRRRDDHEYSGMYNLRVA